MLIYCDSCMIRIKCHISVQLPVDFYVCTQLQMGRQFVFAWVFGEVMGRVPFHHWDFDSSHLGIETIFRSKCPFWLPCLQCATK
ncbi:hypothetical protein SLEP1_g37103 [Rubroshorea leprosula]|uniref:Uncharacterized protein n=1 Tax=Rubroshorea leprosula TaxID=152421 RepID=A0AAV5KU40_9ROSI|nr:hypothetical protein SLEP1_g37103 [Rubroshorea leprosula]